MQDSNLTPEPHAKAGSKNAVDEANVLSTLVSALAPLAQDGRVRLFKTLCTFFDLPFAERGTASHVSTQTASMSVPNHTQHGPGSFSENRTPTPKSFLLEKRPQTEAERVACLAYYLTHYRDQALFKTLDLSKLNTEAAQIKFSNPARAVDGAAASLFLIPAGQGKKQLSAIGEVYVQSLPDRAAARAATADLRKRKTKRPAKANDLGSSQRSDVDGNADDSSAE
jgi:hypothetical protein